MNDRLFPLLTIIALGIWVLVFQNAGLIPAIPSVRAQANQAATGRVRVVGPVDVNVIDIQQPLDVNLHSVVGRQLVESQGGMEIGVSSANNTIIPIHWGEISVVK